MSRVFVTQAPSVRDRVSGEWKSKFDLGPAGRFGEVIVILPPGNLPWSHEDETDLIHHTLADFTEADHLLALGDPVAMAEAVLIAAAALGPGATLSLLKWDRGTRSYVPVPVTVP